MYLQQHTALRKTDLRLKHVNLEVGENHAAHRTLGLSSRHLVVRRGQPFKVTLYFGNRALDPVNETLIFKALLGDLAVEFPATVSKDVPGAEWSAWIRPGDVYSRSAMVQLCTLAQSPIGLYDLQVTFLCPNGQRSYSIGSFVLLCNPWLQSDAVYIPFEDQREEYVQSDFGVFYIGTPHSVLSRPWAFGQYERGILEVCLNILQVSPQHSSDRRADYLRRSDPVYLSRVVCAMINSEDDRGVLKGNWSGAFGDGVNPSDWTGSADILKIWARSRFSPVCYGQCWVFASVMCTVMRVLGIPSRVITIFNSAHDTNGNLVIEEFYTDKGKKLNLSRDSIWNFHLWVECWMTRPDLSPGFDGWQVLDPTPQEKSGGTFCCGPCPVRGIRKRRVSVSYDAPFIYASVNADVLMVVVRDGRAVGKSVDSRRVGSQIYTKQVGLDTPEDLTCAYKCSQDNESHHAACKQGTIQSLEVSLQIDEVPVIGRDICLSITVTNRGHSARALREYANAQAKEYNGILLETFWEVHSRLTISSGEDNESHHAACKQGTIQSLEVSLQIDEVPVIGRDICLSITVTNRGHSARALREYANAQAKEYNGILLETFWEVHSRLTISSGEVLTIKHQIPHCQYEPMLVGNCLVNVAVVIKDERTQEQSIASEEFNINTPQISIQVVDGDLLLRNKEQTALIGFTNLFGVAMSGIVLTVEGSGLIQGKDQSKMYLLQPGETMEKKVTFTPTTLGIKTLHASLAFKSCHAIIRSFHKVSVMAK